MTLNIEILNPKARQLLEDLEALDLIRIKEDSDLEKFAQKIRARVEGEPPSMEEIIKEIKDYRATGKNEAA